MNRRDFVCLVTGAAAAEAAAERTVSAQVAAQPSGPAPSTARLPPARMKAGTQHGDSDEILRVLAGFGVNHICSACRRPGWTRRGRWTGCRG
jgi:hypothetical protein